MGGNLAEKEIGNIWVKRFKDVYSTLLLIFCTVIITVVIFQGNTKLAHSVSAWAAYLILWAGLAWLSMVEGGQASLVGLPPVNRDFYKDSHKVADKIMISINKGNNLDRYLMGRQFLVLALVFLENLCGHPLDTSKPILGMPLMVNKILLDTGLALFFMTAMIGKISAQVNASRCMLDYVNSYFAYFTMHVSRLIEVSGLLHCCYLAQMLFAKLAGHEIESKEAPRSTLQNIFFWLRIIVSLAILCFAFAVTLTCLFNGQTTMWEGIPAYVTVILFFVFMAVVGMLEGMQIAFFAVARMSEEEKNKSAWAKRTCDILFAKGGRNLPGFMVGRQMSVTLCFFIIARVTTVKLKEGDPNIFGVSDGVQKFFETGLLGALITTIVASIAWQLVASSFPMAFLSTPITYIFLRFCLLLEWTGIMQGSWVVALVLRKICRYKRDEVYIGTAEERKEKALGDDYTSLQVGPGHIAKLPAYIGKTAPAALMELMKKDAGVADFVRQLSLHGVDIEKVMADAGVDVNKTDS